MGTDGIFDCLSTVEITDAVREEEETAGRRLGPKELAKFLLVKCLKKCGMKDDMTIMVIEIGIAGGGRALVPLRFTIYNINVFVQNYNKLFIFFYIFSSRSGNMRA